VLLLALTLAGIDSLAVMVGLLAVAYSINGVIVPATYVLAMEAHPGLAGTASALIGTLNFVGGAVVVALVAPFADGRPLPMVAGIAACSVAVFALARSTVRTKTRVALDEAGTQVPAPTAPASRPSS
jgi:DHA1 family bicyclomycin/chloramphenicol resistance-like MFS transporter